MVDFWDGQFRSAGFRAKNTEFTSLPFDYKLISPLTQSLISDKESAMACYFMLQFFRKERLKRKLKLKSATFSVPAHFTKLGIQQTLFKEALLAITKKMHCIPSAVAAIAGLGLDIFDEIPTCIIDVGGGSTDISVILNGEIIATKFSGIAGIKLNEKIVGCLVDDFNMKTGLQQVEHAKILLSEDNKNKLLKTGLEFYGRDKDSGEVKKIRLQQSHLTSYFNPYYEQILKPISDCFESVPQMMKDVYTNNRLFLIGGGSKLIGLKEFLEESLQVTMNTVSEPELVVVRGLDALSKNQIIEKVELKTK